MTVLPEEVLVQIFFFMSFTAIDCDLHDYEVDSNLDEIVDMDPSDFTTVLSLNRRFLELLAPKILPTRIHVTFPILSAQFEKRFDSFEEYWNLLYKSDAFDRALNDDREQFTYKIRARGLQKMVLNHFNQSQTTDYELGLPFTSYIDTQDIYLKHKIYFMDYVSRSNSFELLFSRVLNNENSIMKKFIKSFSVDLLFLDEFQTCRLSERSLVGSLLSEYVHDNSLLSIKAPPFKAFSNFMASLSLNKKYQFAFSSDQQVNDKIIQDKRNQLKDSYSEFMENVDRYEAENRVVSSNPSDEPEEMIVEIPEESNDGDFGETSDSEIVKSDSRDWHRQRQERMYDLIYKTYLNGKRFEVIKSRSKPELQLFVKGMFNDFYELMDRTHIPRRLELDQWNMLDFNQAQWDCAELCEAKHDETTRFTPSWGQMMERQELSDILEEVIEATTINSSKFMDTSLMIFSLKNNDPTNSEAFATFKPKVFFINKPSEV